MCSSLLNLDKIGSDKYNDFIQERLIDKTVPFHAPIKRSKVNTFASMSARSTVTATSKKTKEIIAERNVFGQLVRISAFNNLSLEKVLAYPLGPIPWSLATPDGTPLSTNKASVMHLYERGHILPTKPINPAYVFDGNHQFHTLVGIPDTFGELAEKVFNFLPTFKRLDFVTDSYKVDSIKERSHRGDSDVFIIHGERVRVPRDFRKFFANTRNKMQLFKLVLKEWSKDKYAQKLYNRQLYYVLEDICYLLTSDDGIRTSCTEIPHLKCTQV